MSQPRPPGGARHPKIISVGGHLLETHGLCQSSASPVKPLCRQCNVTSSAGLGRAGPESKMVRLIRVSFRVRFALAFESNLALRGPPALFGSWGGGLGGRAGWGELWCHPKIISVGELWCHPES